MGSWLFQPRNNSFKVNKGSGHQKKAFGRQAVDKEGPWEMKASDPVLTHFIGQSLIKVMKCSVLKNGTLK